MKPRRLTINDLCKVSAYSRHQMRGLLAELPQFARRAGEVRVAKEYSTHDLLVITACARLETRYGLRRATIGALSQELGRVLLGPRPVAKRARLILSFDPPSVRYIEAMNDLGEGLVVPLVPLFSKVDDYLIPDQYSIGVRQRELRLNSSFGTAAQRGLARSISDDSAVSPSAKKKAVMR